MHVNLPATTCTGCAACYAACPKKAITMTANSEGFLYPVVDYTVCILCKLCEKICPVLKPKADGYTVRPKAYACINTDEHIRMESSSGGMFSVFAEEIIRCGGVVFGVRFNEKWEAVHDFTETLDGLAAFRGSKYVQSKLGDNYAICKHFLQEGRKVLFTGTPCQIKGLKAFLRNDYKNLLCIDFICHGVPSPALWQRYVAFRFEKAGTHNIRRICFRRKDYGWSKYSIAFTFDDATEYLKQFNEDEWGTLFLHDCHLRESCYCCSDCLAVRPSDITIADFWGIERVDLSLFDEKGISVLFVHSSKGKMLFDLLNQYGVCTRKEVSFEAAISSNQGMIQPSRRPSKRDMFYKEYTELSIPALVRKYGRDPLALRMKRTIKVFIKKIIGVQNINTIKRILNFIGWGKGYI